MVIPTWRRTEWLRRCLQAVARQTRPADEVIVVGRPEDESTKWLVQRSDAWGSITIVRWIEVEEVGHVAPVRKGLGAATGEIVAFLDDDTEAEPGWLEALLEPFSDTSVGCVGGRVLTPGVRGRSHPDAGRLLWYGRCIGNIWAREDTDPVELDSAMEGNCAWRASVLRSVDFDPVLDFGDAFMYGFDLCLQAKSKGFRVIYQPRARVLHNPAPRDPSLDRADRLRTVRTYSRNYTYIALKHLRGMHAVAFVVWWWLIGERGSYGLATGLYDLVRDRRSSPALIAAAFEGKWRGVTEWRDR